LSQLAIRRLASMTSVNVVRSIAHLWATTPPTPPAPMMRTFDMGAETSTRRVLLGTASGHARRSEELVDLRNIARVVESLWHRRELATGLLQ
jgi:hypothetical protein